MKELLVQKPEETQVDTEYCTSNQKEESNLLSKPEHF